MYEGKIILPVHGGKEYQKAHDFLQRKVMEFFGGYTALRAEGGWMSPEKIPVTESVVVYLIAAEEEEAARSLLKDIAVIAAEMCGQPSVYFSIGGLAHILEVENAWR